MIKRDDINAIRTFFTAEGGSMQSKPDRAEVFLLILARGIAKSIECDYELLRGFAHGSVQNTGWRTQITVQGNARKCELCLYFEKASDRKDSGVIPLIAELTSDRKCSVKFGGYSGTVDLDDPKSLATFYSNAAEEVALHAPTNF